MIKFILLSSLILTSYFASAETLTCSLRPMRTLTSGLVPDDNSKLISLSVEIVAFDQISSVTDLSSVCASSMLDDKKIELCAMESAFIGGYSVSILTTEPGFEIPTSSEYLIGKARNGKGLNLINAKEHVLSSIINKMSLFKISMPEALEGDSLLLDEALVKATSKGVLKKGDLILMSIDYEKGCSIN